MKSVHRLRLACGALAFPGFLIAMVMGFLLSAPPVASGQSIFAHLSGTVTDSSEAVVGGAKVTVTENAQSTLEV